jgi:hypothetical protein
LGAALPITITAKSINIGQDRGTDQVIRLLAQSPNEIERDKGFFRGQARQEICGLLDCFAARGGILLACNGFDEAGSIDGKLRAAR